MTPYRFPAYFEDEVVRKRSSLKKRVYAVSPHRVAVTAVDIYFENVGGAHLEAALEHMNIRGRIALCGMISQYNESTPSSGPRNLRLAVRKRLTLTGFIVSDHVDRQPQFYADMGAWIADGKIKWEETIVDGIENAPKAFRGLFTGENMGKMLVRIGPEAS